MALLVVLTAGLLQRRAPSPTAWMASSVFRSEASGGAIFDPSDYGGDPTGVNDSAKAVQAALDAAAAFSVPGHFIGNGTNHGGATVDLRGGAYRVSTPLWVGGTHGGGMRVCCGALLAAAAFPRSAFILNVGEHTEDTTFEDLQLDCAQTGGGLHTSGALRVHVSRVYVHGFTTVGVRATQGHEVHLTDSFLGQWWWGEDPTKPAGGNASGTAVLVDGQDHWVDNIIVFSAAIGIEMRGGAAVISNSHVYNGGGPALLVRGHAIRVLGCYFDFNPVCEPRCSNLEALSKRTTRWDPALLIARTLLLHWAMLDPQFPTQVVILGPIVAVDVSHSFFLGAVGVELRASDPQAHRPLTARDPIRDQTPLATGAHRDEALATNFISGLQITHNQFVVGDADPRGRVAVYVNESAGPFVSINQTIVAHNVFPPATYGPAAGHTLPYRATEATITSVIHASAAIGGLSSYEFDFTPRLLFDCTRFGIATARHSVVLPLQRPASWDAELPRTALRMSGACMLQVVSEKPLPAGTRVSVIASQLEDA